MISAARRMPRTALELRRFLALHPASIRLAVPIHDAFVDSVTIHHDGTVAAEGWARHLPEFRAALILHVGAERLEPTHVFRIPRPDLGTPLTMRSGFLGAVAEWVLQGDQSGHASIFLKNRVIASFDVPPVGDVPYGRLRTEPRVLERHEIYGSGSPVPFVAQDYCCGAGALVVALRRATSASGSNWTTLEFGSTCWRRREPSSRLYFGSLPTPFRDAQFNSVSCCEVMEHIPHPATVAGEIARLAAQRMLITVPDMSAIPRGFHHGIVPWHLLEATHVNFFTQHGLEQLLAPHVGRLESMRNGLVQCDRLKYFTNLAVVAER